MFLYSLLFSLYIYALWVHIKLLYRTANKKDMTLMILKNIQRKSLQKFPKNII
jgi:hypothetical protein